MYSKITEEIQKSGIEIIDIDLTIKKSQELYFDIENCEPSKEQLMEKLNFYSEIIENNPDNAEAYYERGCIYSELEKYEEALSDLNKALEYNYKEKYSVYFEAGQIKQALGDYIGALEEYKRVKEEENCPVLDLVSYSELEIYDKLKDYQSAISVCNEAIRKNNKDFISYFSRSEFKYKLNNYEDALNDFLTAYKLFEKESSKDNKESEFFLKVKSYRCYYGYLLYTALNNTEEANKYLKLTYETYKDFDVDEFNKEFFS